MPEGALLDTSFLITFSDPSRVNHAVARLYFDHFIDEGVPMFISTIAIAEFEMRQRYTDLPLEQMIVLPYNADDAVSTALLGDPPDGDGERRAVLKDDYKLLGQARAKDIAYILTEDERTLAKYCRRLRGEQKLSARIILMSQPFDKSHFDPFGQRELIG